VRVSAKDETAARDAALSLAEAARTAAAAHGAGVEVLGPAEAPIAKLRGRYRQQILLKHREAGALWRVAERVAAASQRLARGVRAVVDVNPVEMM
jgi:primosomal protein N' (replication factor Y)